MLNEMKEMICNYVEVDPDDITEESRFIEDLGLTSYDFMCLLGDLEATHDVTVDEAEIIKLQTVGDAITYLEALEK